MYEHILRHAFLVARGKGRKITGQFPNKYFPGQMLPKNPYSSLVLVQISVPFQGFSFWYSVPVTQIPFPNLFLSKSKLHCRGHLFVCGSQPHDPNLIFQLKTEQILVPFYRFGTLNRVSLRVLACLV